MYVLVRCFCVREGVCVCFGEGNVCVLQLQCSGGGDVYILKRE